jgi:hypothetical protein
VAILPAPMNAMLLLFNAFPHKLQVFLQVYQVERYSSVSHCLHAPHVAR